MKIYKTFESFTESLKDSSLDEGRAFVKAVNDAREAGLNEFEFNGKVYPVKEKVIKEKEAFRPKAKLRETIEESNSYPAPGISKAIAHKMLFENNSTVHGLFPKIYSKSKLTEEMDDDGNWNLEIELASNPSAGIVFWEPAMKGDSRIGSNTTKMEDANLYLHNFYSMTAAKSFHGLITKMLTHPAFKDNPNPRDKNNNLFPEQLKGNMKNVKVMALKDFVKKYPKAVKAVAEWKGAMWDESPWSYMYDKYFNSAGTKFRNR